jgi:hypothetical protein
MQCHKHVYYKKEEAKHEILELHGLTVMYKVSTINWFISNHVPYTSRVTHAGQDAGERRD